MAQKENDVMRAALIHLILFVLLTGCAPQPVIEAAQERLIIVLDNDVEEVQLREGVELTYDRADFKIAKMEVLPVSEAERENGVTGKWCLGIDYLIHERYAGYVDGKAIIFVARFVSGDVRASLTSHDNGGLNAAERGHYYQLSLWDICRNYFVW